MESSPELGFLGEWLEEIRSKQPLSKLEKMEREMEKVQQDWKTVESRYGEDVLQLVIASGY